MQEISIKRPTRGTPTPSPAKPVQPSGLILPEEPEETSTPSSESTEDENSEPSDSSRSAAGQGPAAQPGHAGKKIFIRTFGCQMNEYDSDKMVDVLRQAEGAELVSTPKKPTSSSSTPVPCARKRRKKYFPT